MEFVVENMSCGHCKMTIEKALKEAGVTAFDVDLSDKTVRVESSELSEKELIKVIESKGYQVK